MEQNGLSDKQIILGRLDELTSRVEQLELAAAHSPSIREIANAVTVDRYKTCMHRPVPNGYGHVCSICGLEL